MKGYPLLYSVFCILYSGLDNSNGLYSPWSRKESDMTETLSLSLWASRGAQLVKNLPAMQETPVQSLDWEDPLKK